MEQANQGRRSVQVIVAVGEEESKHIELFRIFSLQRLYSN